MFSHSATDSQKNLDDSKLHLNIRDSKKMLENCVKYLKGFSSWVNVKRNKYWVKWIFLYCQWWRHFQRAPTQCIKWRHFKHLSKLRRKNIGHLILTHISINSFSYKFDQLVYGVRGKVDVLMVTEIKLDDSFPTMQFNIKYITLLN